MKLSGIMMLILLGLMVLINLAFVVYNLIKKTREKKLLKEENKIKIQDSSGKRPSRWNDKNMKYKQKVGMLEKSGELE